MILKNIFTLGLACSVTFASGIHSNLNAEKVVYDNTWESLSKKNDAPEWMKDAKFGIYTHWGLQTELGQHKVAGSLNYYNNMYKAKMPTFEFHKETYGDQKDVGYKDLIDHFKAKDFDAEVWAQTFYDAGARFAGMVVIHHDNVAMFDSAINQYNMKNLGPKKDITGELEQAYRKRGMHFLATFHNLASWGHSYLDSYQYDGASGEAAALYNEPHKKTDKPSAVYIQRNVDIIREVIQKYSPDGIWFDFGFGKTLPDSAQRDLAEYYYNRANTTDQDVVFIHKHGAAVPTGMNDTERGRPGTMQEKTFMNDESIGIRYWFFNELGHESEGMLPASNLVHMLIDLVSKNGVLLLNIAPDRHGNIPTDQKRSLAVMGDWLKVYGKAIYNTRPWETFGEGPFQLRFKGSIAGKYPEMREYTQSDIRYSRSKDGKTIYATALGRPTEAITIKSMRVVNADQLKMVKELSGAPVQVSVDKDQHPVITVDASALPSQLASIAYSLEIPASAVEYDDSASKIRLPVVELNVDVAVLAGDTLDLIAIDTDRGIRALGPWKTAGDQATWQLKVPSAGTWALKTKILPGNTQSVQVHLNGESKTIRMKRSKNKTPRDYDLGSFQFDEPGVHSLVVHGVADAPWRGMELYELKLEKIK